MQGEGMNINLNHIIDQVVKDKGIDRAVLVEALEAAVLSAANKKYRNTRDLEAHFNDEIGEVEVFEFVTVVDEVENSYQEIDITEAQEIDPDVEIGDSLGMKMDASSFSRIAAQTAKQVIIQKVREAEREGVYNEFKGRLGELVNGIVRRYERGDLIIDLGRTEALLPHREQVPRENYRQGDRVRAYISDVRMATKGPQIILSRTHPGLLIELFRIEVPEVAEGIVEIKAVSREPGSRAKIAVSSNDPDVDPIGACVGMRGARVQNVVSELRGEKIDIINWTPDIARFACAALSPAEVTRVYVDSEEESLEIIVPDDQLSLAIGKKGQNVRLAAKLTGWKIDIMSETRAAEAELEELTGAGDSDKESAGTEAAAGLLSAMTAKDAIAAVKEAESVEDVATMTEGETRVTVLRASEARTAELTDAENAENVENTDNAESAE
jgi:N utilization substance protein A